MTNDTRLIRILSVDDHPLLRSGIAALVDTQSDMRMVGEASNGNEAVQLHRQLNPDVTLMDLQMPDMSGLDAIIALWCGAAQFPVSSSTAFATPAPYAESHLANSAICRRFISSGTPCIAAAMF
jgi:DNA-binding NarL/FixJ family response regulator